MGYRYSLAYVTVTISRGNSVIASFGGQGSMIGSISVQREGDRFSVDGDATGGAVVNENLSKIGSVSLEIKQCAPLVETLTNLFNSYDDSSTSGYGPSSSNGGAVNIALSYNNKLVSQAKGCYLNMPELSYQDEAQDREFSFVACEVDYERNGVQGITF